MCDLIKGETAMRKFLVTVGLGPAALAASMAMADDLSYYSPYEILSAHLGCAEPGMVALHVKFDTQASASYRVDGLSVELARNARCTIPMRKGTDKIDIEVPCAEGVAETAPTEEELSLIDGVSNLPEVVNVKGEIYHCVMPEREDVSRQTQRTLSGSWLADLPESAGFTIGGGDFAGWKSRALFYPSRTELLFDGYTEVTLPPYLRLFLGSEVLQDDNEDIYGVTVRLEVDLQLVPRLDGGCGLGGEKC
jgi:hypothetical protein